MSDLNMASTSPGPSTRAGSETGIRTAAREQAIIDDALRRLPPLDKFLRAPHTTAARGTSPVDASVLSNTSLTSSGLPSAGDGSTYALGAEDEELLLQELTNMTAGAAPFVLSDKTPLESSSAAARDAEQQGTTTGGNHVNGDKNTAPTIVSAGNTAQTTSAAVVPPKPPVSSRTAPVSASQTHTTKAAGVTRTQPTNSKEEQAILDAILTAVEDQQSSVSGDLTASTLLSREEDTVEQVLEQAKLLASSTVSGNARQAELVLHIHEHVALQQRLAELRRTAGMPTCVALPQCVPPFTSGTKTATTQSNGAAAGIAKARAFSVAMGTTLGVIALFDARWGVVGICGSVDVATVNARGAVVSLSLCTDPTGAESASSGPGEVSEATAATGHARGVFILWSLHTFAPLKIVKDECTVPLLRLQHLHHDPHRVLVLESSGSVKLFQFWQVLGAYMLRSVTVTAAAPSTVDSVSDLDTVPLPSAFYIANLHKLREWLPKATNVWNNESGVPWLWTPPPLPPTTAASTGVSRTSWSSVRGKHLVAAVTSDAALVYLVDASLHGTVTGVARHTHLPSSVLSSELARFVVSEQDGATPRLLLCVAWNTEIELLSVVLKVAEREGPVRGASTEPAVLGLERVAMLRTAAPLVQMVPLAGCSVLLLDQANTAQLLDASVAVMVEQRHFCSLEYVSFIANRMSVVKYHGTVAGNHSTALLFGKHQAYSVSLYSWRERLNALMARRKFSDALDLAKSFAEEVALATVGLSSNVATRRRELHQYMERVLLAYLASHVENENAKKPRSGDAGTLLEVLQYVASYCSTVDALDLLYGPVARALQQRGRLPQLLYVLERLMRHGVITYLPEALLERFLDVFLHEDKLGSVEVALGVRAPPPTSANGSSPVPPKALHDLMEPTGQNRAELALMCLDTGLPNLLRLAQEHRLVRLAVSILSFRQRHYADALAYALDAEEERQEKRAENDTAASVAIDLVESTLKDCALVPGADIAASEQRPAKRAILEYLLQTHAPGRPNLLRFLRLQPQHAVRVLLFALSDEGVCSPWSSGNSKTNHDDDDFTRTQFVSSVYFLLTDGTRTAPRRLSDDGAASNRRRADGPINLFFLREAELSKLPKLRMLRAAELDQRVFPPYAALHIFLSGAATFNALLLSDGDSKERNHGSVGGKKSTTGARPVQLDVWIDLVLQDGLYVFQNTDTMDERRALQEQLVQILTPSFIPRDRVAAYQPDFARLRMTRCLAALLCNEQRYTEAIGCYLDPAQSRVDPNLSHDVFAMLRGQMRLLQDQKSHAAVAALSRRSASERFDVNSDLLSDQIDTDEATRSNSPSPALSEVADGQERVEGSRQTSTLSSQPPSRSATNAADVAIKALQRAVMSHVEALVRIDPTALAQFVFDYLPANRREVVRLLRGSSTAFLDYLDELLAHGDRSVAADMNLQNTYIELLCAHAPERVCAHLQDKDRLITYDVQLALRAVRKHRIADASIYLLEKTSMVEEAMEVMVKAVRAALAAVREEVLAQQDGETASEDVDVELKATESDTVSPAMSSSGVRQNTRISATTRQDPPAALSENAKSTNGDNKQLSHHSASLFAALPDVSGVTELYRLLTIGKELCTKYQRNHVAAGAAGGAAFTSAVTDSRPSQHPEYWFRLLDVFMVPRRLLCEVLTQDEQWRSAAAEEESEGDDEDRGEDETADGTGMDSEVAVATRLAVALRHHSTRGARQATEELADDAAFHLAVLTHPLAKKQRASMEVLVSLYTHCTSDVLRAMMSSLDLAVVVDKVVQDNKGEAFRPFKPIILDMMASLSFDLEASRLCEALTEGDVTALGRELYRRLNTGVVAQSDCCGLCRQRLRDPPRPASLLSDNGTASSAIRAAAPASPSAVYVYTCGHAFHSVCSVQAMGPQPACYACAHQRFCNGKAGSAEVVPDGLRNAADVAARQALLASSSSLTKSTLDLAKMQRRIRQTKVKIDHTEDLYPLLQSYLAWGDIGAASTPSRKATTAKAAATAAAAVLPAGNWVLAPSPRIPVAIGDITAGSQQGSATPPAEKDFNVETLTDAEILELFGDL